MSGREVVSSERDSLMAEIRRLRGAACHAIGDCGRAESERDAALTNLRDAYAEIDISHRAETELRSERDYLRERLRELAEEWRTRAARNGQASRDYSPGSTLTMRRVAQGRWEAFGKAATDVERIVTDSETGGNETATREEQDAPTPQRGWAPPPTHWTR